MKEQFLDLGRQPIANGFLYENDINDEFFFNLKVGFDANTCLVSLMEFVKPEKMFNDNYVYHSSMSQTMRDHFKDAATKLKNDFRPQRVLEIGSNDGAFIRHFHKQSTIAVEPCGNFAELTNKKGYTTYNEFWDQNLAERLLSESGKRDMIYSANCMCHIQDLDDAFMAVKKLLSPSGVFVFEDPSLSRMMVRRSYDQIYDEHAHIFSVIALDKLLSKHDLEIFKVENLEVHGGSNRIYVKHRDNIFIEIDSSVSENIFSERHLGLDNIEAYKEFAKDVNKSKERLVSLLTRYKNQGKKIISYGATSKSTTVFNYCGITSELIDYIVDTTKDKQGKLSSGVHIPVVEAPDAIDNSIDIAFLGAWNYEKEIVNKEESFLKRGGVFVTHVPGVRTIGC